MSTVDKRPHQMSATQRATHEIRRLIFTGELTADSNHLESELAERLGISRTPVREATLLLQASGLLEVQPRKGVRISAISIEDMKEISEVLTELECLAARLTAESGYSKTELAELDSSIEAMDTALQQDDLTAWANADEAFHVELARLSKNRRVQTSTATFHDQVRRARSIALKMQPLQSHPNTDHHRLLLQTILAGDSIKANELHRTYRMQATNTQIDILESSGLKRV